MIIGINFKVEVLLININNRKDNNLIIILNLNKVIDL